MALVLFFGMALSAKAQEIGYDEMDKGTRYTCTNYNSMFTRNDVAGGVALGACTSPNGEVQYYLCVMLEKEDEQMSMAEGSRMALKLKDGSTIVLVSQEDAQVDEQEHNVSVPESHTATGWRTVYNPYYDCLIDIPVTHTYTTTHDETHVSETLETYYEITAEQIAKIISGGVTKVRIQTDGALLDKEIWNNKFSKGLQKEYQVLAKQLKKSYADSFTEGM